MKVEGDGKLLRIFIGESDRHGGRPLFEAIIRKAHELGLAGATAWQGIEGFGAHSRIHTAKILRLSEDLPIIVEIVDAEDKIRALLPQIDAMMESAGSSGLITMESVQVFKYE
jgi:PII-like signaling protein